MEVTPLLRAITTSLLGEQHPHRLDWMADYTLKILSGQTEQVIASFQQMAQDKTIYSVPRRLPSQGNLFLRCQKCQPISARN